MKKCFNKILAVVLSALILMSVGVVAVFAGDETTKFDFISGSAVASAGVWKEDYVEEVTITLTGNANQINGDMLSVKLHTLGSESIIKSFNKTNMDVYFSDGNTIIVVKPDMNMDHSLTYCFDIQEGSFKNSVGAVNNAFTVSETGNALIESIGVDRFELPTEPLERFIYDLEHSKYADMLYWVIMVLKFIASL